VSAPTKPPPKPRPLRADPVGLTTHRPWLVVNLPRSRWYVLKARGLTPPPLNLPGRATYRTATLIDWVESLDPGLKGAGCDR
jgi:hypothetical protein